MPSKTLLQVNTNSVGLDDLIKRLASEKYNEGVRNGILYTLYFMGLPQEAGPLIRGDDESE